LSGLYSDDILSEVARANDIVEVISSYFPLKRAGKDYKALCPFHPEKTPSFTVSPNKQIFKCFGCGKGGSVFNFVMAKENLTFPEAIRFLAERAGIELKDRAGATEQAGARRQLREVLDWATQFFERTLRHPALGTKGRQYLEARGITQATIDAFRIGFAPEGWDGLLKAATRENIPPGLLEAGGLVAARETGGYYDRFRGRVMFPILDPLNRPVAFGGRAMGSDEPKYLNSPETALFHKGEALYGLPQARPAIEAERRVVVVEGYFDVVMPHQVGVKHVVATLGTALTSEHVRALRRFADEVILVFDSDLAGRRAADRGIELFLGEDVRIYVASVTGGKDPCDLCHDQGADAFRACLASAKDALAYKWDVVREQFGAAQNPAAQRRALDEMLGSLAKVDTLVSRDPSVRRDLLIAHISHTLGVSEQALRADLARIRRTATRSAAGADPKVDLPPTAVKGRRWAAERELLTALVCRPSRLDEAVQGWPPDRIEDAALRQLYEALLANTARRDGDIESVVLALQDDAMASLAVELFERGDAIQASRSESDTGPGPLGHMMDDALAALQEIDKEDDLAARSRAASAGGTEDTQALHDFAEASKKRHGFLPPGARQRPTPEE